MLSLFDFCFPKNRFKLIFFLKVHIKGLTILHFRLVCATIYDGTNQSGASADLPVGEFNAYVNSNTQMPLGDRTESVSVTQARGFNKY